MDCITEPLGKILITEPALPFAIFVGDQLLQVGVVQISLIPEVLENVLHGDKAIVIGVQGQKCFPH